MSDVTRILSAIEEGDPHAAEQLLPLVYEELRRLAAQKLAGKVPISGQDADLAAVKRVIDGTQTMTVYKPLKLIATEAAKLSVQLARNEKPTYSSQYDNGSKKVDTILLTPTPLTKANIDLLEKDGFYTKEQIGQ